MIKTTCHWLAITSLIALIFLNLGWELIWAPLREGGSWLVVKALLLLLPLRGILAGKVYTYQWSSMFILLFFTEGIMRGFADAGLSQQLAWAEIALSCVFFIGVLGFIRCTRQANLATKAS